MRKTIELNKMLIETGCDTTQSIKRLELQLQEEINNYQIHKQFNQDWGINLIQHLKLRKYDRKTNKPNPK